MKASAVISGDYRRELRRVWDDTLPLLAVCMLNPSTADAEKNDPTILTLIAFAKLWGYGGIVVVNLFAFRSSSPMEMRAAVDPIGGYKTNWYIANAIAECRGVLAAWGAGGGFRDRDKWFTGLMRLLEIPMTCLGVTKDGHPKHPLARGVHRIPRDQVMVPWTGKRDYLEDAVERMLQSRL